MHDLFSLHVHRCLIWHVDQLKTPLDDDLADMVAQARTATQEESTDTTPVESISGSSTALSSSLTAPLTVQVPIARVQKLEAQMATLLHHIRPLMQRSITKEEERFERKMVQHTERKIAEVHQRLDAFEVRVLARQPLRWMC